MKDRGVFQKEERSTASETQPIGAVILTAQSRDGRFFSVVLPRDALADVIEPLELLMDYGLESGDDMYGTGDSATESLLTLLERRA